LTGEVFDGTEGRFNGFDDFSNFRQPAGAGPEQDRADGII